MKKITVSVFIFWAVFVLCGSALADRILIIRKDTAHEKIKNTILNLNNLKSRGVIEAVDVKRSYPTDYDTYKQYDQIWDLNYAVSLSTTTMNLYKDFLKDGGKLYLSGEFASSNTAIQNRNITITSFLNSVDAVEDSFFISDYTSTFKDQNITEEGKKVFPDMSVIGAVQGGRAYEASLKNGFLVSEDIDPSNKGRGSFFAWDKNNLSYYPDARLFVGLDVDFLGNSKEGVSEDLINYLSGNTPSVPVPAAVWLFVTGLAVLGVIRRNKDKKSAM